MNLPVVYARFALLLSALLLAIFITTSNSWAQTSLNLAAASEHTEEAPVNDHADFQQSLDAIINTLEDQSERRALIDQLKTLQLQGEPASATEPRQGLLGALADTIADIGEQAHAEDSPADKWSQQLALSKNDLTPLLKQTSTVAVLTFLFDISVLAVLWAVVLLVTYISLRRFAAHHRWPLDLPREPGLAALLLHFFYKTLPWALAFAATLLMIELLPYSRGIELVVVLAYVALVGRVVASLFETIISVFTRGHRYTAVRILRTRALLPLFLIGALLALGDALSASNLRSLLGPNLAATGTIITNLFAALISVFFILRFKRPMRHVICHRPYATRKQAHSAHELVRLIGRLWHIPALLTVIGSIATVLITVGDIGTALAQSIASGGLLIIALLLTNQLRRYNEHFGKKYRPRVSEYQKRLERFAYALGQMTIWVGFIELSFQLWGGSLLGIGQTGLTDARIGQALVNLALTILAAWLVWIMADTGIQRALASSERRQGHNTNRARAQTITPMIRNVIFATIIIIAAIIALANLGVNITPLLAGAGVIGLAVGFGAQTLVQDLITGIFILIEDSLAIDDFVEINGHMGTVEGLTLRTVRLRDLDGILHIITFSHIASIHNMSRQFGVALMRVRVPHEMKIDQAIALMEDTAADLREDPTMRYYIWSPLEMQGVDRFDEGGAILRMRFRTAPVMQWDVARAFNLRLKQRMEQQGLDLGAPRLSVSMETPISPEARDESPSDTSDTPGTSAR